MIQLYNTVSRAIEEFTPFHPPEVGLYTCGMTVYDFAHIGHGKKYVGDDILRRVLEYKGYHVTHVQNITDVGHLSSDSDEGEDKMEKGAKKYGKTVWDVAAYYADHFFHTMDALGNLRPTVSCKATDHIGDQVKLIQTLIDKGYAYDTSEAVYFDVSKFPTYGDLFGQKLEDKLTAVRDEVQTGQHKKNPIDFALWFKRVGRFSDHAMHWDSPWGDGFPGWHIECSAMSMRYLGSTVDIHTGGIDHIPIHHPNEIAQSEAATGKQFVRYWVHHAFLMVDGKKMSKSLGNFYTIDDVREKGYDLLSLRYLYLSAQYRKPLNFTWEALGAAHNAYTDLTARLAGLIENSRYHPTESTIQYSKVAIGMKEEFIAALEDDLNTPRALAVLWRTMKSDVLIAGEKISLIHMFDTVLGLQVYEKAQKLVDEKISDATTHIPDDVQDLLVKRQEAKAAKLFTEADQIRKDIEAKGYTVVDTKTGAVAKRT